MKRPVTSVLGALAILLAAAPAAQAQKLYTAQFTGTIKQNAQTTSTETRPSDCNGSATHTGMGGMSVTLKKPPRLARQELTIDSRGFNFRFESRFTAGSASWTSATQYNWTPQTPSDDVYCPTAPRSTTDTCRLAADDNREFGIQAVGGRLTIRHTSIPNGLFSSQFADELDPGTCTAEQEGSNFLDQVHLTTSATLRKVKALKKGKSLTAKGKPQGSLSGEFGRGTRTVTLDGSYRLVIKRVK